MELTQKYPSCCKMTMIPDEYGYSCQKCSKTKPLVPFQRANGFYKTRWISLSATMNSFFDDFNVLNPSQNLNNFTQHSPYRKLNRYARNIPESILTEIPIMRKRIDSLITNEQYLPLTIKQSGIENAGNGVFTNVEIEPKTILLIYTGDIGLHSEIRTSNSLFDVGFIKDLKQNLVLDGRNIGRFVNSKRNPECNCKMTKTLFYCQERVEIGFVLYTEEKIRAGEQLFYDYGANFELGDHFQENLDKSLIKDEISPEPQFERLPIEMLPKKRKLIRKQK